MRNTGALKDSLVQAESSLETPLRNNKKRVQLVQSDPLEESKESIIGQGGIPFSESFGKTPNDRQSSFARIYNKRATGFRQ